MISFVFDDEYIDGLRRRDDKICTHFHGHFRPIIRIRMRAQFAWDVAEDMVQDVLLAVLEKVDSGEPREAIKFGAYVAGVCNNMARQKIRDIRKQRDSEAELDVTLIPDWKRSAERQVISKQQAVRVQQLLKTLKKRNREVLEDLFFHGLTREEVSQKQGLTKGQLRMILFHALEQFRNRWGTLDLPGAFL